jgi:predicted transcriptional regulator
LDGGMTKEQINAVLDAVRTWPEADQEELAEIAREIETRRTGVYAMNDDERAGVREGLDEARRGEFVPDDAMNAFWKKYDVL